MVFADAPSESDLYHYLMDNYSAVMPSATGPVQVNHSFALFQLKGLVGESVVAGAPPNRTIDLLPVEISTEVHTCRNGNR